MADGKVMINDTESEAITLIFKCYAQGLSYSKIAELVEKLGYQYHIGKSTWNKNMIARILQDNRYLGTQTYSLIIDNQIYEKANAIIYQKQIKNRASDDIQTIRKHIICGVCGNKMLWNQKTNGNSAW